MVFLNNYFLFTYDFKLIKILGRTILILIFSPVGALTSKPLAFRYWSWELESTYIVNLTDGISEKIRIDLKNKEVIRTLPWLKNNEVENWISDKSRFTYDGFNSNKVVSFYVKKKLCLIPIFYVILLSLDPLNLKIFNNNYFRSEYLSHIASKDSFFKYSFSNFYFFKFLFFKNLNYSNINFEKNFKTLQLINFISKKTKLSYFNFINLFWKWITYLKILNKLFILLNNYIYIRVNKLFNNKNLYLNNLNFLTKISPQVLHSHILIHLLDKNFINKHLIYTSVNSDLIFNKVLNNFINLNEQNIITKKTITLLPTLIPLSSKLFFWFNSLPKNLVFDNYDLIITINTNLRLSAPKIFLSLRKLKKKKNIRLISFGDNYFYSNFFLNFGFSYALLSKVFSYKHWVLSFFKKKKQIGFLIGENILNILKTKFFIFKKYFEMKNILYNYIQTNTFNFPKIQTFNYRFHLINSSPIFNSLLFNNNKKNINKYYKKINYKFLLTKKIGSDLNSSFSNWNTPSSKFLNQNTNLVSTNYNFLFESNMPDYFNQKDWDIIFPVINLLGSTYLYKSYDYTLLKSLFVKNSPNLSWINYCYILTINFFLYYPYILFNNYLTNNFFIVKILTELYLKNNFLNIKKNKFILTTRKIWKNFFKIKLFLRLKKFINFSIDNVWYSQNSYVLSSKYTKFGYSMVSLKNKTFNK